MGGIVTLNIYHTQFLVHNTISFERDTWIPHILTHSVIAVWSNIGVPDAPGSPKVSDISETSATLTWTPPSHDGGSPVTSYQIEKREGRSGHWTTCNKFDVSETSFVVRDLRAGHDYAFRVIAINKAGPSKPSYPSEDIKAQPPYGNWN